MAAVEVLTKEYNYYQWGSVTPEDAAQAWNDIIITAWDESFSAVCQAPAETPYWDDESTVDDEEPAEVQQWYGYVTDLDSPTTTFVEDVGVWTFAGLLALAGAPAAAIAFTTVAPKFIVAIRRGELGEIIRLYVDGSQQAEVDTSDYAEGDIIQQPIITSGGGAHDLLLVKAT